MGDPANWWTSRQAGHRDTGLCRDRSATRALQESSPERHCPGPRQQALVLGWWPEPPVAQLRHRSRRIQHLHAAKTEEWERQRKYHAGPLGWNRVALLSGSQPDYSAGSQDQKI